ncbi:MAG: hypothetical protein V4858_29375 [Pseudomonadota bacterium]
MSFLNQLKQQATALQSQQTAQLQNFEANAEATEWACQVVWRYLQDLARQLTVITPDAPRFSLDGKTPWPQMKLADFRADSRKKNLRDKEVYDYIAMGWDIVPKGGMAVSGSVSVNFPPDLERVKKRLAFGHVEHEQKSVIHPEKNTLQAIRFEYDTRARGNVTVTADHDNGQLIFRLANADGFGVVTTTWAAPKVDQGLMDELAKMVVAQPNRFL